MHFFHYLSSTVCKPSFKFNLIFDLNLCVLFLKRFRLAKSKIYNFKNIRYDIFQWFCQCMANVRFGNFLTVVLQTDAASFCRWHKCTKNWGDRKWPATFASCFKNYAHGWGLSRSRGYSDGHRLGSIHGSRFYSDSDTSRYQKNSNDDKKFVISN